MSDNKFLDCAGLRDLLARMPDDAFVIAFFIQSVAVSQDEWLNPLALHLREKGFVTVGIQTPYSLGRCDLGNAQYQALVKTEDLRQFGRINVFIISDMDCLSANYPDSSKVLGCCHAFDYASATSLPYSTHFGGLLDGWMCSFPLDESSRIRIGQLWNGLIDRNASRRKERYFRIIPAGYPRMTVLANELRAIEERADSIVYAPIEVGYNSDDGGNRLRMHGKRIIRTLLSCFPDMKVIFRPYKNDLQSQEVLEIQNAFANETRFVLDDSPGRAFAFSRGAVLVTDLSHVGKSFAYATLRPAIYFKPWVKGRQESEWGAGHFCYSYSSLAETIHSYLASQPLWREKILKNRNRMIVPFERAFEDIAGWIEDFYHDRPRPEWVSIERLELDKLQTETELICNILRQYESAQPGIAASCAIFSHPESLLLKAFAFHLGMWKSPKSYIYLQSLLKETATRLPGKIFDCRKYEEVDPDEVRLLYSLALRDLLKVKDMDGIEVARGLLENFNLLFPEKEPEISPAVEKCGCQKLSPQVMDKSALEGMLKNLPDTNFVVALYIHCVYASQDEWLNALAIRLREKGFLTIGILTPQSIGKCNLENVEYQALVPADTIHELGRINVFIISDMDCDTFFPSNSKVLACVHSLYYASIDIPFQGSLHFSAILDGWMVPMKLTGGTRTAVKKLWTGFVDTRFSPRKSSTFQLIPVGYPRLAAVSDKLRSGGAEPDSIVYAPILMKHAPDHGGHRVKTHGLRIIRLLLDNFPGYNVIFRPSPQDSENAITMEIMAVFGDEERFVLDRDSGQVFAFSRGAALVTDLSNVAKSFAFATLRPGIFFTPWQDKPHPLRTWDGGFCADTYDDMLLAVRKALENPREESERIRKASERLLMPIDNALDEIANWLPDFYAEKSRPDWLTIERGNPDLLMKENEVVKKIIEVQDFGNFETAWAAALYHNPCSPLLAAFALHRALQERPSNMLKGRLREIVSELLGINVPSVSYGGLDKGIVIGLYKLALAEKRECNDVEGVALVEKLIGEFSTLCEA